MPLWSRSIRMGFQTAKKALPLAALPFALDLFVQQLYPGRAVTDASVEFTLPVPFPSLSQVHGQPSGAVPFFPIYPPPDLGQLTAPVLLLLLGIQSYAAAGYLGALDSARLGGRIRRLLKLANIYFARVFAFNALIAVILLVLHPFMESLSYGALVSIFTVFALLIILYFLFLTPFCIVVDDYVLAEAFRKSVELALQAWREVIPYCLTYATITVLASAAILLLVALPIAGIPLAVGLYGLLGTALVASTLHLYDGLRPEDVLPVSAPHERPAEEAVPT